MSKRRVIQLVAAHLDGLYALCDDGTLWLSTSSLSEWSDASQWMLVPTPADLPAEPPAHVRELRASWAASHPAEPTP